MFFQLFKFLIHLNSQSFYIFALKIKSSRFLRDF